MLLNLDFLYSLSFDEQWERMHRESTLKKNNFWHHWIVTVERGKRNDLQQTGDSQLEGILFFPCEMHSNR